MRTNPPQPTHTRRCCPPARTWAPLCCTILRCSCPTRCRDHERDLFAVASHESTQTVEPQANSTAQHSTAQHSTAQHCTAQQEAPEGKKQRARTLPPDAARAQHDTRHTTHDTVRSTALTLAENAVDGVPPATRTRSKAVLRLTPPESAPVKHTVCPTTVVPSGSGSKVATGGALVALARDGARERDREVRFAAGAGLRARRRRRERRGVRRLGVVERLLRRRRVETGEKSPSLSLSLSLSLKLSSSLARRRVRLDDWVVRWALPPLVGPGSLSLSAATTSARERHTRPHPTTPNNTPTA